MAACSSSRSVVEHNSGSTGLSENTVGAAVLPAEIVLHIFSLLNEPGDLANATIICKRWHAIAVQEGVWSGKLKKIGVPAYPFDKTSGLSLSKLQVMNMIAVALMNIQRIRQHVHHLKSLHSWTKSHDQNDSDDSNYAVVSKFLATAGLPIDKRGLIAKKLPELVDTEDGPVYPIPLKKRILIAPVLLSASENRDIILEMSDKDEEERINLFFTNQFLRRALYYHNDGKTQKMVCKELQIKAPGTNYLKYSRSEFLRFTHLSLRAFFTAETL